MRLTSSFFLLFLLLQSISYSYAQNWNSNAGFLYYNQGNVGIGTTTQSSANLHIGKQEARANSVGEVIRLSLQPYGHTGGPWNFVTRDSEFNAYLSLQYNTLPIFILSSNGDVTIGSSILDNKININGTLRTYNKNAPNATWDNLSIWTDGETSYIHSFGDEKGLHIKSTIANKIILDSFVGIGTDTPQNRLDVNGTISAKEIKVTLNGWSDFVLKPSFKLRPLSEIKHYIEINGHLPEIPSEAEVMQNGVNMGDMQAKLLQKIEELTLYMIKLSEENKQLREEVNNIKINVQKK